MTITPHSTLFHETHDFWLLALTFVFAAVAVWLSLKLVRNAAVREGEAHFRVLAESIPEIVWTAVPRMGIDYCNRRWCDLTGLTPQQTMGRGWQAALHRDDLPAAVANWRKARRTGTPLDAEYRVRTVGGSFRWLLFRAVPMRDSSGAIVKWFGSCIDINDQRHIQELLQEQIKQHTAALMEANARLQQETIRDPLTGLYNRRYLEETLERETRRAVRAEHSLSMLILDLDYFKKFNDTFGHEAGDVVLRATAAFLVKSVRSEDIVCRMGGEEFVIILPMADLSTARNRAERIRSKLRELSVRHQIHELGPITVSVGVAAVPQHGTLPAELLQAADAALYTAKRQGRDRVAMAEIATTPESTALEISQNYNAQLSAGR